MSSILKWIWSAIKWVGQKVLSVFEALWNVLSSLLTWVIASISYLLQLLWNWVTDAIDSAFGSVSDWFQSFSGNVLDFPIQVGDLFGHFYTLFSIPDMVSMVGLLLTVFVIARLARLAMVPVRAVLEIL